MVCPNVSEKNAFFRKACYEKEVDNLMIQLLVLPNPFTCPHGRPTAIKMTKTDLEKKFSRR